VTILSDRIQERLDALGLSAAGASVQAGLNKDAIRNILRGRSASIRSDSLRALAAVLQCSESWLVGGGDKPVEIAKTAGEWLDVRHEVGIGYWKTEPHAHIAEPDRPFPVARSERYADADQWLERVLGDRAALRFPAGTCVHAVSADAIQYRPAVGDIVVVAITRDGFTERSIRAVAREGSDFVLTLQGLSPDPGEPLPYPHHAGEVAVVARVIGAYVPLDR
jgi:transcriptional regulator with XRE-family HTH domain